MAYTALYRKWRPDSFESVVGQEHIVRTLTNQIMANRIGHAYLLCGTRGTGKTSTAKIFAKAVNCEHPVEGNPCNQCRICQNIQSNQSMNIIEIDAASNNGVDNIREIREEVRYTPTEGKYKVYIIDEVHMLSQGAFNALLKTLEEPPSHVIFILATTEPHKLPATILSRCQRYDFRRISVQTITDTLLKYLGEEAIEAEVNAVRYVAKVADGSMRDALSILDQCIAFYLGEKITLDKVLDVLGAVDTSVFEKMLTALHDRNIQVMLDIIEEITLQGRDLNQWVVDMVTFLRNVLIIKSIDRPEMVLEMAPEDLNQLKGLSQSLGQEEIIYYIKHLSELEQRMKFASQKRVLLEIEFVRLCEPTTDATQEGLTERIRSLEKRMEEGVVAVAPEPVKKEAPQPVENRKTIRVEAIPQDIREAILRFNQFTERFSGMDKALLKKVVPANLEDQMLYMICENEIHKNQLIKPTAMEQIHQALEELHQKKFNIRILTADEYNLLAHESKDISTGVEEAKKLFEIIKSKINFDIKEIN